MGYIKFNKILQIEKYTIAKYWLCVDNKKYLINEVAKRIIEQIDGKKKYNDVIDNLCVIYNDSKENVQMVVNEFLNNLKIEYGIEISESKKKEDSRVKIIGTDSYYPKAASVELTERCNICCKHCYGNFGKEKKQDLELENAKKILANLRNIGVTTLELTGGDVSVYDNLLDVLQYAVELGFTKINILTNGIIIKKNVIEYIIENRKIIGVQIDLHSLDDAYYKWFTGAENVVSKVMANIEKLTKNDVELRVATIFTHKNLNEFSNIAKWVSKRNAKWGIGLVEQLGRAIVNESDLFLNEEEVILFESYLEKANREHPGMISVIDYLPNDNNCGAITSHVVIDSRGNIKLCTMDDRTHFENEFGNCLNKDIREIYDDNKDFLYILAKYGLPEVGNSICGKCENSFSCSRCLLRHFINMKQCKGTCRWYEEKIPKEICKAFEL